LTTAREQQVVPEIPEEVREIKERIATFVREELHPFEAEIAERGEIDEEKLGALRKKARAAGFSNLNMPKEYGGMDLSVVSQVTLEEEAGKTTNGLGYMVADRGPRELLDLASPEQIERYVMPVVRGETREAWAITEPEAGSDIKDITTTATRDGEEWVLAGEKWFVTGGERAGFFIVLAWAGEQQASFLVDRDAPGLEIVRTPTFMHDPYASKHVELRLNGCRVPSGARLGEGGDEGTKRWFSLERVMIAARCCGAAERLVDLAREWALERKASGRALSEYQAIQFMLADCVTELNAARLMTYHVARAWDRDDPKVLHGKTAMAKLFASEMAGRVADRVVQIFGGRGYMTENPAERYYRELRVDRIWEGTSEIQRLIIARGLLKRGAGAYRMDG
jgi:alkylation response protein AidB-like acyl-CoA dehydrogenase